MFDLISVGDSVIDTFIPLIEALVEEKNGERRLSMLYGDKIPVEPSVSLVAGNAANNAVGASRLNMKVGVYTNVGEDVDAQKIINEFKKEQIDTRYVVRNQGLPSNHHVVLDFKGERTILIYHQPWKFHLPELDRSKWVYLTSLSPTFVNSRLIDQLIQYLERTGCKLFYNPGTFQIKLGVKKNPRLLSLTEVLIANLEETKLILGIKSSDNVSIKKLLKGVVDLGPKMVVVTDGQAGSYGFDGEKYVKLGIFPAKLLEMTGAGDAYATATLAGLFHGKILAEAMRWGAANGASVVEQVGPQAGLLSYEQMQVKLQQNLKVVAREL